MAKFTSASVEQISNDANGATFRCTVSASGSSYFGLVNTNACMAIKNYNGYLYYWGFPLSNHWKASWNSSPDYRLVNGSTINSHFGSLQGRLDDRSYSWTQYVPIDRGNSRQGTKDITVGLDYNGNDQRFGDALITTTLYTTAIPYGEIQSASVTVDDGNTTGTRYIRISCTFTNPESYHTCRLTDSSGKVLATSNTTTLNHNIEITQDLFQKNKVYKVELFGKDNRACPGAKTLQAYIEPSGVGLWTKQNSIANEITTATFKNVNFKQIKEVWVRIDGTWVKTIK